MAKGIYIVKHTLTCKVCSNGYTSQRSKSIYCSNLCRNIQWRKDNRSQDYSNKNRWKQNNIKQHNKNQSEYKRSRIETDLEYKLKQRVRSRLGRIKFNNSIRTIDWLGCSMSHLKVHLENQFQPGMNWSNYGNGDGKWNIDHIKPLALFNLLDDLQLKEACGYINLQPLWWRDNLVKSDKYEGK